MAPSEPGPEKPYQPAAEQQEDNLHQNYLEALIYGDLEDLVAYGNAIEDYGGPFSDETEDFAYEYAQAVLNGDASGVKSYGEKILKTGLRAYIYSGLTVNQEFVKAITEFRGKDTRWLKKTIKPSRRLLDELEEADSRKERRRLRNVGRNALFNLGIYL